MKAAVVLSLLTAALAVPLNTMQPREVKGIKYRNLTERAHEPEKRFTNATSLHVARDEAPPAASSRSTNTTVLYSRDVNSTTLLHARGYNSTTY